MEQGQYRLRRVERLTDWHAYHNIRRTELFDAYWPGVAYDTNHPDEHEPSNLPHVLELDQAIVGTIRIDLMGAKCAAFRLIAVRRPFQGQGHGSALLRLAEALVAELGCAQVTVNAVAAALPFFQRSGYAAGDWHDIEPPQAGTVRVGKAIVRAMAIGGEAESSLYGMG